MWERANIWMFQDITVFNVLEHDYCGLYNRLLKLKLETHMEVSTCVHMYD